MAYTMYVYKGINKAQFAAVDGQSFFLITAASACFIIVYFTSVILNLISHLSCKNKGLEMLSDPSFFAGCVKLGV